MSEQKWRPGLYVARVPDFPWRNALKAPVQSWLVEIADDGNPKWGSWSRRLDASIPQCEKLAGWLEAHGSDDRMLMVLWASSLRHFGNVSWGRLKVEHPYTITRPASVSDRPFCRETKLGRFLSRLPLVRHYKGMNLV